MDEAAAQPHAIREMMARSRRFVVSKLETINGVEKVPYSTQGHRTSATNPMEHLR
jgi:hypothetical protein